MPPHNPNTPDDPSPKCCTSCQQVFDAEMVVCPNDGTVLTTMLDEGLVGTVFADRYEIVSVIGEGGMGKVYKARHKLMRRIVAVKVVHPHLVSSASTLTRFQQEAEAASCLNHPNIVGVHDFGLVPRAYLVMDYLDGVNLGDLLENDAHLNLDRSLPIFVQICAGLAHAHDNGVVHRDLKPSNVMLLNVSGHKEAIKIVDFGIAKLMLRELGEAKHLTATGEIFGSPLYMSPEQCRAKSMDARSDIYSLGCIMYRTLTGHQPILGQELIECLYNHVNITPTCFADICPEFNLPQAMEAIVMKCMEKEQEKRYQSMHEVKEALLALDLVHHPREIEQAQPATAPSKWPKENSAGPTDIGRARQITDLTPSGARELGLAAFAAEASRAASAAEAGLIAFAFEESLAACAAEAGRAALAAESARATSAAEAGRAASAAEAGRAASAAEAGRAAFAAEAGRAASAHEAGLAAFAAEAGRAAAAAEAERAASATEPGTEASEAEVSYSASAAQLGRSAYAAEASRAASAAESARAASATEAGLAAFATEAAFAASAHESALAASAHEASLAASAREAGFAASAAEAGRAASAAESGRAASAAEAWRAASAAEVGRAAFAAEVDRAASAAEAARAASTAEDQRVASNDNNENGTICS